MSNGDGQAGGQEGKNAPVHPATLTQKIFLSVYLVALSIFSVWYTCNTIGKINGEILAEISTPWQLPDGFVLNGAPPSFHYDPVHKKLVHRGLLTAEEALKLRDLLALRSTMPLTSVRSAPAASGVRAGRGGKRAAPGRAHEPEARPAPATAVSSAKVQKAYKSYDAAIDSLVYLSSAHQGSMIQLLLRLGLVGGALGAILRSLVDFIGNACYKNRLDLEVWWPLYLMRPVVGAILGFLLVVLFKAKLLTAGGAQPGNGSFWWLGIAVIGGFSTVDVTLRLRLAAKALFGVHSGEQGTSGGG